MKRCSASLKTLSQMDFEKRFKDVFWVFGPYLCKKWLHLINQTDFFFPASLIGRTWHCLAQGHGFRLDVGCQIYKRLFFPASSIRRIWNLWFGIMNVKLTLPSKIPKFFKVRPCQITVFTYPYDTYACFLVLQSQKMKNRGKVYFCPMCQCILNLN